VRVVTATRADLGYDDLTAGERRHIDDAFGARDSCVQQVHAGRTP
jgi:hypothetical protein